MKIKNKDEIKKMIGDSPEKTKERLVNKTINLDHLPEMPGQLRDSILVLDKLLFNANRLSQEIHNTIEKG